ncbi:hypothetical protein [Nocardioides sp.]|uniref:hypothetical protein n=1 Tax=Nocardioides sp. TaxID=35761 RepID=UPI00271F00B2|nr:hypothetical protein [Nocardioides sp.]MDO9455769.1 hypothetical protein [Nocardioides sp.]
MTEEPPIYLEAEGVEYTYVDEYRTVHIWYGGGGDGTAGTSGDTGGDTGGAGNGTVLVVIPDADAGSTPTLDPGEEVVYDSDPGTLHTRKSTTAVAPDGTSYPVTQDKWLHSDGSWTFTQTSPGFEATGSHDSAGNQSYSSRQDLPDGGTILVTRTQDAFGHGTDHTTRVDAHGNTVSDETTSY